MHINILIWFKTQTTIWRGKKLSARIFLNFLKILLHKLSVILFGSKEINYVKFVQKRFKTYYLYLVKILKWIYKFYFIFFAIYIFLVQLYFVLVSIVSTLGFTWQAAYLLTWNPVQPFKHSYKIFLNIMNDWFKKSQLYLTCKSNLIKN